MHDVGRTVKVRDQPRCFWFTFLCYKRKKVNVLIRLSSLRPPTDCQWRSTSVEKSSWNVMAHVDTGEGKWRGNWRMEWVASTLHTTSKHGVSSITTADAHTSAASSRLNWRPRQFKWTRLFRRKMKSGFCACAITFQTQSTQMLVRTTAWAQAAEDVPDF